MICNQNFYDLFDKLFDITINNWRNPDIDKGIPIMKSSSVEWQCKIISP